MRRDSFDRQMTAFQTVFWIMFALVAIFIIGMVALQIVIGIKIAQDPNGTAQTMGNILRTFLDAAGIK